KDWVSRKTMPLGIGFRDSHRAETFRPSRLRLELVPYLGDGKGSPSPLVDLAEGHRPLCPADVLLYGQEDPDPGGVHRAAPGQVHHEPAFPGLDELAHVLLEPDGVPPPPHFPL